MDRQMHLLIWDALETRGVQWIDIKLVGMSSYILYIKLMLKCTFINMNMRQWILQIYKYVTNTYKFNICFPNRPCPLNICTDSDTKSFSITYDGGFKDVSMVGRVAIETQCA